MGAQMFDAALMNKAGISKTTKKINENMSLVFSAPKRKEELRRLFRILDEQDAVNRYRWFNIPFDLSSQEIERLIYFKGSLVAFYFAETKKFYLMPFALDGGLDFYGRYNTVHPVPMADGTPAEGESKPEAESRYKSQMNLLSKKKLKVVYDVALEEELENVDLSEIGIILHDYTKQMSQTIIPRVVLNECLVGEMADMFCYCETAALIGTGITGYKVDSEDAKSEVNKLSEAIYNAAINKNPYIAIVGSATEFQELGTGQRYALSDYLMTLQSMDNLRLSTYGIPNGGIFEKQAHVLEKEIAVNNSNVYSAYQDGLSIRQHFCNIFNSIFKTFMWCEASEDVVKQDLDGDGVDYDREAPAEEQQQEQGGSSDGE